MHLWYLIFLFLFSIFEIDLINYHMMDVHACVHVFVCCISINMFVCECISICVCVCMGGGGGGGLKKIAKKKKIKILFLKLKIILKNFVFDKIYKK